MGIYFISASFYHTAGGEIGVTLLGGGVYGTGFKEKRVDTFSDRKALEMWPRSVDLRLDPPSYFVDDMHDLWYTIKQKRESVMGVPGKKVYDRRGFCAGVTEALLFAIIHMPGDAVMPKKGE